MATTFFIPVACNKKIVSLMRPTVQIRILKTAPADVLPYHRLLVLNLLFER